MNDPEDKLDKDQPEEGIQTAESEQSLAAPREKPPIESSIITGDDQEPKEPVKEEGDKEPSTLDDLSEEPDPAPPPLSSRPPLISPTIEEVQAPNKSKKWLRLLLILVVLGLIGAGAYFGKDKFS